MSREGLIHAQEKMVEAGIAPIAIDTFTRFYKLLEQHNSSYMREDEITPVERVVWLKDVLGDHTTHEVDTAALGKTAVVRLNGGLGTSMGLQSPKSLLPVRDGKTFLDIIAAQTLTARATHNVKLPLVFMNSQATDEQTCAALEAYPNLAVPDVPLTMVQNYEPKLVADTLEPVEFPQSPELEWCPPGHGDLYTVLQTSGVLESLSAQGIEYLFVANVDNLGAYPSPEIASWFEQSGSSFVIEVAERTVADRKGGHLVVKDGRLALREGAQIAPEDAEAAGDISVHKYFNSNSLWIRVSALQALLKEHNGVLPLPLIANAKTVDPADKTTEQVIQIECAMGAAIELFEDAQALVIDRSRFLPVKTTNNLLVLRSDIFDLDETARLIARRAEPLVTLDPEWYAMMSDFDQRIGLHVPSLMNAESLTVTGPWTFSSGVSVKGDAVLTHDSSVEETVPERAVITEAGIVR
ncbi:UTP--glucose-1-phosphate uridylyltransferase [Timonella sp. A28]|uniref:UTP--glucose-1-phosphate uridylyltransferase n=1 Tax=Timonella sp. A28 TaxID=3442640 RepID=UPI003EBA951F